LQDDSQRVSEIPHGELFAPDRAWLIDFLARHGASRLIDTVLEHAGGVRPGEHQVESEFAPWTIRGETVSAQMLLLSQEGIELGDATGRRFRLTYEDLGDEQGKRVADLVQSRPELGSIAHRLPRHLSTPPAGPPRPDFAPPPSMPPSAPSGPGAEGGEEFVSVCSNCQREVPAHLKAGEKCPHCQVSFDYVEHADGSKSYSSSYLVGQIAGAVLLIAALAYRFLQS
jgi:hypothetical protein